MDKPKYLIWSNEHRAWWRPKSRGYTINMDRAGRYDREEAISICALSRDGWGAGATPSEIPVLDTDAADCQKRFLAAMASA